MQRIGTVGTPSNQIQVEKTGRISILYIGYRKYSDCVNLTPVEGQDRIRRKLPNIRCRPDPNPYPQRNMAPDLQRCLFQLISQNLPTRRAIILQTFFRRNILTYYYAIERFEPFRPGGNHIATLFWKKFCREIIANSKIFAP
mgnify:CR=1 FL=1